jgi:hypothetical protein
MLEQLKFSPDLSAHAVYAGITPFQTTAAWPGVSSAGAASSAVKTIKNDAPPSTHHHLPLDAAANDKRIVNARAPGFVTFHVCGS